MKSLLVSFLIFIMLSCDRPDCRNMNSIFNEFKPTDESYKRELVKQLKLTDTKDLSFWLLEQVEIEEQIFLIFSIQGHGLCSKIAIRVDHPGKLKSVIEKDGVSFRGAQFVGLTFDIEQDSLSTQFVYKDFDKLID